MLRPYDALCFEAAARAGYPYWLWAAQASWLTQMKVDTKLLLLRASARNAAVQRAGGDLCLTLRGRPLEDPREANGDSLDFK